MLALTVLSDQRFKVQLGLRLTLLAQTCKAFARRDIFALLEPTHRNLVLQEHTTQLSVQLLAFPAQVAITATSMQCPTTHSMRRTRDAMLAITA